MKYILLDENDEAYELENYEALMELVARFDSDSLKSIVIYEIKSQLEVLREDVLREVK